MQQPGIVGLHCVTSTNALHFAYTDQRQRRDAAADDAAGGVVPADVQAVHAAATSCDDVAEDRRPGEGRAEGDRGRRPSRRSWPTCSKDNVAGRPQGAGAAGPQGRHARGADDGGPAADLPQGHRLARLQVQLGGAGGLLPRDAGLAAPATWRRASSGSRAAATRTTTSSSATARRWRNLRCRERPPWRSVKNGTPRRAFPTGGTPRRAFPTGGTPQEGIPCRRHATEGVPYRRHATEGVPYSPSALGTSGFVTSTASQHRAART